MSLLALMPLYRVALPTIPPPPPTACVDFIPPDSISPDAFARCGWAGSALYSLKTTHIRQRGFSFITHIVANWPNVSALKIIFLLFLQENNL
jgi:hypothetical protein